MSDSRPSRSSHVPRCALLAAWCGLVWYLSDQPDPGESVGILVKLPDWLLHGVEFAVGGFLARHALRPLVGARALVPLLFCIAWALLDELHQSFVPGRDPSWTDVLADVVGAQLGVLAHAAWSARRAGSGRK